MLGVLPLVIVPVLPTVDEVEEGAAEEEDLKVAKDEEVGD